MLSKRVSSGGLIQLLNSDQIRRVELERQAYYAARDVVAALAEQANVGQYWDAVLAREPRLAELFHPVALEAGTGTTIDFVDLAGVFRLAEAIDSPRAQKIKAWLAESGRRRLEEAENPELIALRARRLYEQKGYPRRWVDKRLRGISARHELTSEWYKRGATESEDFRTLTNRLMHSAFGMDVEGYRRYKNVRGAGQNLRDHMSDLELALTSLGETTAVALHQARNSKGFESLGADAKDAGEVVALALAEIQRRGGKPVITPANNRGSGRALSSPPVSPSMDARNPSEPSVARKALHGRQAGDSRIAASPKVVEAG
jgi:DNA-damage-inducible protein D